MTKSPDCPDGLTNVLDFRSRKPVQPEQVAPSRPQVPPPPTDGLVLACSCGSTNMELLNAGVVRCARCGAHGRVSWGWNKPPQPKKA